MYLPHRLLRYAGYGRRARRVAIVHKDVLEEFRGQAVYLHPRINVLGQDIVGHVNGAVAQGFNQPLFIPGQMSPQALAPGAGLVLEPVHLVDELCSELLRYDLHPRQTAQHIALPLRVGVLQKPLVPHHHDHTAGAAAADHRRLGELVEYLRYALLYQIGQEHVLDLGDGNAGILAGIGFENAVMKLPPVDHLGGLFRLGMILICHLQLVNCFHCWQLTITG